MEKKPVFDSERDRYLLMVTSFEGIKRYDYALVDVEIRKPSKFWIHYDGLEDIVLAFYSPEKRKLTEFAIAWNAETQVFRGRVIENLARESRE